MVATGRACMQARKREMQAQVHACKQWQFVCNASQHTQGASHAAARRVGTHHVREAVRFTEHHCQCLQGGRPCSEMQAYMRAGVNACKVVAAKLVALSGQLAAQPAQGPKTTAIATIATSRADAEPDKYIACGQPVVTVLTWDGLNKYQIKGKKCGVRHRCGDMTQRRVLRYTCTHRPWGCGCRIRVPPGGRWDRFHHAPSGNGPPARRIAAPAARDSQYKPVEYMHGIAEWCPTSILTR